MTHDPERKWPLFDAKKWLDDRGWRCADPFGIGPWTNAHYPKVRFRGNGSGGWDLIHYGIKFAAETPPEALEKARRFMDKKSAQYRERAAVYAESSKVIQEWLS